MTIKEEIYGGAIDSLISDRVALIVNCGKTSRPGSWVVRSGAGGGVQVLRNLRIIGSIEQIVLHLIAVVGGSDHELAMVAYGDDVVESEPGPGLQISDRILRLGCGCGNANETY